MVVTCEKTTSVGPEWVILASGSCSGRNGQAVVLVMHAGAGHDECGPVLDDRKRVVPVLEEEPMAKVWDCSGHSEDKIRSWSHLSTKGLRERG